MVSLISLLPFAGLTLAWLIPLHFLPWLAWHGEVPVFAAVFLTGLWAVAGRIASGGAHAPIPLPGMVLGLFAIAALAIMQAAAGSIRYWGDAWVLVLYLGLAAAAFLLGRGASLRPDRGEPYLQLLAATLVLAGAGCSVIAIVQNLDAWSVSWIASTDLQRPGSNLAQPNQMGTLVLMGVVSLVFLHERGRLGTAVAALLACLLAAGLITTESRTALVSYLVLAGWWFAWRRTRRLSAAAVAGFGAALVIGYMAWPYLLAGFHGLAGSDGFNTNVGLRTVVWPQLAEAALQHPWLGWGLRQTPAALTSVLDRQELSAAFPYAHNLVLDLVLGVGVPLTVVMLGAAAVWAWRRRHAGLDPAGWFAVAIAIPFLVHAMLEFPHTYAYLLVPAMMALGFVDASVQPQRRLQVPAPVAAGVLGCVAALGAWSAMEYVTIEEDFRVARFEAGRIGVTPTGYERPTVQVLTQLDALLEAARVTPAPGMTQERIGHARDAAYRFPWPAVQNRYALALALNGHTEEALRMLRVIRAMHGERLYSEIRTNWEVLSSGKHPQLASVRLP